MNARTEEEGLSTLFDVFEAEHSLGQEVYFT